MSLKSVLVLVTAAAIMMLSGCNDEDPKTVEWWSQHDSERKEFVEECKNDSAEAMSTNCQNAMRAESKDEIIGDKRSLKSSKISLDGN
ncbi:EexN family lipoprotein [Salinicola sp. NYA28a]